MQRQVVSLGSAFATSQVMGTTAMPNDALQPVRFDDPRRIRIHERLSRLGEGPASMFRDACRVLDAPMLENAGVIVAHLMRELKSSIEKVLLPPDFMRPQTDGNAAAIAAILTHLGLPANHKIATLWKELNPQKIAHRRALGAPLPVDAVRTKAQEFEHVLETLLDELDRTYAAVYKKIDLLLAKPQPGSGDVSTLRNEIPQNPPTLGYFFEQADVARWLDPLRRKGMFTEPPTSVPWLAMQFLERAAETHAGDVAVILATIAFPSGALHQMRYLATVARLSTNDQARLLTQVLGQLGDRPLEDFVARDLGKAATRLASSALGVSCAIVQQLLVLRPSAEKTTSTHNLASPLDSHIYGVIARDVVKALLAVDPGPTFAMVADTLDAALGAAYADAKPEDKSKGWRASIAPHSQNHFFNPLANLGEAVRLAAEVLCAANPVQLASVVESCEQRGWKFFRRLALHLLTLHADPASALVHERVLRMDNLQERDYRREYHLLVENAFPHFAASDRQTFIEHILAGPDPALLATSSPEDAARYREKWITVRLGWIAPYLPDDVRARYDALVAIYGAPTERDDFSGWVGTMWVGPTSPVTSEDLTAMPLDGLMAFLRSWEPERAHMVPTREGLGRDLQKIAKARAPEFSARAREFEGFDATYVRTILAGLEDAVKAEGVIDWDATLDLCAWVVAQPRMIPDRVGREFDDDPHWGYARSAIGRLLDAGLRAKNPVVLPRVLRDRVWNILLPLTDDPDPDDDRDNQLRDPLSTAINSTRGVAFEALMRYAVWVRRGSDRATWPNNFEDLPEVREVLDRHLDPAIDRSPAIRAVYGQWLFFLHDLAPAWVTSAVSRLLPEDDPQLAGVLLQTYVLTGEYTSSDVRALLEPELRRAIECLKTPPAEDTHAAREFPHRLGQQFVLAYLHGDLTFEVGSLLAAFFEAAPAETRTAALAFAVEGFKNDEGVKDTVRERIMALWAWRVAAGDPAELRGFGHWVGEADLDATWRLAQLETALLTAGTLDYEYDLMPALAALANEHPEAVLRCTRLAINGAPDYFRLYSYTYDGDVANILETCIATSTPQVVAEARAIANELVARGMREFLDLARGDGPLPPEIPESLPVPPGADR
jgi:hypothetical protein